MERKFVNSCRMMHNLIKLHHVVKIHEQLQRTYKRTDVLTQRLECTPVGRSILFRLSTHALQAPMRVNNELTMTKSLIHYDVYVPMSCLSSWLQSLPTKRENKQ